MSSTPPQLAPAVVLGSQPDGRLYQRVVLGRPTAGDQQRLVAGHRVAGQYVLLTPRAQLEPAFFAIARAPGCGNGLELLIKREGDIARELAEVGVGGTVLMSEAMGKGFALERLRGCDVLLLAAGSGVAAVHAALEALMAERDRYGWIHLYYGQASVGDFAFTERLSVAQSAGIAVTLVDSSRSSGDRRTWVQHVADEGPHYDRPDRLGVIVCGMAEMEDATRARCIDRGVTGERILTNHSW